MKARKRIHSRGMTLIELMIVVVIIGILSVIAVTGFRKYTVSARNAEAHSFLNGIRATQEAYYQSFGQYCGTTNFQSWPAAQPTDDKIEWLTPPPGNSWADLGIKSPGWVWFQYDLRAGSAADALNVGGVPQPSKPWFQVQAHSDFDGDGLKSTFEVLSVTTTVYTNQKGE